MNDLAFMGQYVPGTSFLHRLDPRTKLMAVLVYSILIFVVRDPRSFALAAAFAVVAVGLSRLPVTFLWRGLRPVLFFLLIAFVLNALVTPGEVLFRLWVLKVTREGLQLGTLMALRLVLLVAVSSLLTMTTTPISLTDGLERLLRPFRAVGLPAAELALMMTIALRFIPTLLDEAGRIRRAQEARGARFQVGGPLAQMRALLPILVPLFVAAFRRADELAVAMEARGYRGGRGRTRMKELRLGGQDAVAALGSALFCGAVLWLWWQGRGTA